ncbi:MAG: hypothetical protein WA160_13190 [Pseudobdellovibrio sp.]
MERKKLKPDFEALLQSGTDSNKILLIPSGSKNNRTQCLIFDLTTNNFKPLDFTSLFKNISYQLPLINIEGAAYYNNNYLFLNRGVADNLSSIIHVDSKTLKIKTIQQIDFGEIENIPLHGSELCLFDNYLYALAVAEDTKNSFDDGKVLGSSLFKISLADFKILDQWQFDLPIKTEGLCRWQNKWLVTTDPDGNGTSDFFSFII